MKSNKTKFVLRKLTPVVLIAFVIYNVILFSVCGFDGHGRSFWISYAFMMISFLTFAISRLAIRGRKAQPQDWLFGFPILKHCGIYLIVAFVVSVVFMVLDHTDLSWSVSLIVQFILLTVHLVLILSCFRVKAVSETAEVKAKQKVSYIKLMMVDVEMIVERCTDAEVKAAYEKLSEQLRYSDPMSNEALKDLEKRISKQIEQAKLATDRDEQLRMCNEISLLVTERNKKCKVLK